MNKISLSIDVSQDFTTISNVFIDEYMPHANGDFVKAYLFLQRCLNSRTEKTFSISGLADCLENTEKDILRAIGYWEKMKLLSVKRDAEGNISSITLRTPEPSTAPKETSSNTSASPLADTENGRTQTSVSFPVTEPAAHPAPVLPDKNDYLLEHMGDLSADKDFIFLRDTISVLMGRMLVPQDAQLLVYLMRGLKFSNDLIYYLYEYCISKNISRNTYIESVAINWYEESIHTVEEAKKFSHRYSSTHKVVKKAFGFTRPLGEAEDSLVQKWSVRYHMSDEMIKEACTRSLMHTGTTSFEYADSIIERWHKEKIQTLAQAAQSDQDHHKKQNAKNRGAASAAQPAKPGSKVPYNQYPQRNYSSREMDSLEKQLLMRGDLGSRKN